MLDNAVTERPSLASSQILTPKQTESIGTPAICYTGAPPWRRLEFGTTCPNQQQQQTESFPHCTKPVIISSADARTLWEHKMIQRPNTLFGSVEDSRNVSPIRSTTDSVTCASQPLEPNSTEQGIESTAFKTASEAMWEFIVDRMKSEMKAAAYKALTKATACRSSPSRHQRFRSTETRSELDSRSQWL